MDKKKIVLMEFESNPNIGLYMFANDKFCIVGKDIDEKKKKEIEEVLKVKVYIAKVLGTELIGVFISGNNDILLVPNMHDYEMELFEKIAKENNVKLIKIEDKQNTLGNSLCVGNEEIIASSSYPQATIESLKKKTKLNIIKLQNKELPGSGGVCKFANGKYFISQELSEKEVQEFIDKIGGNGTVNSGAIFVSSGIVGNSFGLILGSASSTVEIQSIVESLEYL